MSRYYAEAKDGKEFSYGFESVVPEYFLVDESQQEFIVGAGAEIYGSALNLQTTMQEKGLWESVPENHKLALMLDNPF